ncbi:MAG: UDP-N-acetylglucosamine diphosphorylase [Chlamydiae bacterium]|nr:UDP-N-acetylglucosamine diphosphorylase [Chlamydiota bacterium]
MPLTSPQSFFAIEEFEHSSLFQQIEHVWEVLPNISIYLSQYSLGEIESPLPDGLHLENPHSIRIGKNCLIEPGCFIKGPCIIGDHSEVRQGAYIRGNVITGKKCIIGHATEIKNSILLDGAKAPHFNYVGDSILGKDTNLGAGVICSNLRLDNQNINFLIKGRIFSSKSNKIGLILGDRSQIGCNTVSNPGTLIGKDVLCFPSLNIGGWIPEKSMIKGQKFSVEVR